MPDILPVCMQDFLYSRKPDLRAEQIIIWNRTKNEPRGRRNQPQAALCFCVVKQLAEVTSVAVLERKKGFLQEL